MTTDIDNINMYIENNQDSGCKAATDFLLKLGKNTPSKCMECPFVECIDDLDASDRNNLKRHESLKKVYMLIDEGKSAYSISHTLGVPQTTINRWLANRRTYEARLYKLVDMIQYVGEQRSNARV